MNSAVKNLRDSNPRAFEALMKALSEDLGVDLYESVTSFSCPNCGTALRIVLDSIQGVSGVRRSKRGRPVKKSGESLNDLLIQLARVRRVTTGVLNAEFTRLLGERARGMSKQEIREQKISWLKKQLGRPRGKKKVA